MSNQISIAKAKEEILFTLELYLSKNEFGQYEIPTEKQRPILLMGPPGIGKTAIMEQIASEKKVALVSYTITHHTRQSAIGLPVIRERNYGSEVFSVTEYTMSEIIASIYECMEQTGLQEGILFLDEINCVSETLAPTMLQFLQYKTFGTHRVPEGWMIVVAGNPAEYNRSVRPFDIATLDRVKRLDIVEDYDAWKSYAYQNNIHPAILSYLDIRRDHFYRMEATVDGDSFVTARGWEDLSHYLTARESHNIPVSSETIHPYLQHDEIARGFASYYELFSQYKKDYHVGEILSGQDAPDTEERLRNAAFDEAVSAIALFLHRLFDLCEKEYETDQILTLVHSYLLSGTQNLEKEWNREKRSDISNRDEERHFLASLSLLRELETRNATTGKELKELFAEKVSEYESHVSETRNAMTRAFTFLEKIFAGRQEMILFTTELTLNPAAIWFISTHGCEKYFEYNRELLIDDKREQLVKKTKELFRKEK